MCMRVGVRTNPACHFLGAFQFLFEKGSLISLALQQVGRLAGDPRRSHFCLPLLGSQARSEPWRSRFCLPSLTARLSSTRCSAWHFTWVLEIELRSSGPGHGLYQLSHLPSSPADSSLVPSFPAPATQLWFSVSTSDICLDSIGFCLQLQPQ